MGEAARQTPQRVDRGTVWRWCRNGYPTPAGVVTLEHVQMGRRLFTTIEWLADFAQAIAAANTRTETQHTPSDDDLAADAHLERLGL